MRLADSRSQLEQSPSPWGKRILGATTGRGCNRARISWIANPPERESWMAKDDELRRSLKEAVLAADAAASVLLLSCIDLHYPRRILETMDDERRGA